MVQATKQQMVDFLYNFYPYTKKQLSSLPKEKLMEAINRIEEKQGVEVFKDFVKVDRLYKKYNLK